MAKDDPSTPSSAYTNMAPAWSMIEDILAGIEAIHAAGEKYLPKYESESGDEYKRRLEMSPWRALFADALHNLSSKPFESEVRVVDGAPETILGKVGPDGKTRSGGLVDDIDARGNSLTRFARAFFDGAIAKGLRGILVEYPTMAPGATLEDARRSGARPYWVDVRAEDIIAYYTAFVDGKETCVHLRIKECSVERDGYDETKVTRVREFNRPHLADGLWGVPTWTLWRQRDTQWEREAEGTISRGGKKDIPFVMLWTGERLGEHEVRPPLKELAHMQIELYRSRSRKEEIMTYAGSPMLAGNGIAPPADGSAMQVGPKRILYAPPGSDGAETGWDYVQPNAANIKEIREDLSDAADDFHRLAMQPLTKRTGNITATATSVEAAKAHSQVQAWALDMKDVFEQAFVYTTEWLSLSDTIRVDVDTDFAVGVSDTEQAKVLVDARKEAQISQETLWSELQRRNVLGPQFDAEAEKKRLKDESPPFDPDNELNGGRNEAA